MTAERALSYEVKAGLEPVTAFTVCGLSAVIDNGEGRAAEQINDLWQVFFEKQVARLIEGKKSDVIYAVYSDYEGDHTQPYRLTVGYAVEGGAPETGEGLFTVSVEAGTYATLSARGPQPKSLVDTWVSVWESDLERTFHSDFEVYGPRFFEEGVHEVLLYIGIREPKA